MIPKKSRWAIDTIAVWKGIAVATFFSLFMWILIIASFGHI